MPARSAGRRWSAARPTAGRALLTAYVPLEEDRGQRRGKRRHAGERRGTRDQSRSRRHYRARFAAKAAHPMPSSRSTTKASRTVPTCGATTAWRAKWRRFSGWNSRDPAKLDLLPQGPAAVKIRDRRSRSLPAVQRAGFRERHGAAVAVVAAIPADGDRPEPDQQHRRYDELRDGRTGAADARVRRGSAARGHHLRPRGEARRTVPRAQRRSVHARPVEPGDRGCGGRDRAGGRDRRRG